MNVFAFRNRIIEDYARFSRSFTRLRADDIQNHVDAAYAEGRFWPPPLIQLNPNFVPGKTIDQLVAEGVLETECRHIFRTGKGEGRLGKTLHLHRHQEDAMAPSPISPILIFWRSFSSMDPITTPTTSGCRMSRSPTGWKMPATP